MDINKIKKKISEHYPQWASLMNSVDFRDADCSAPAFTDGYTVYYNSRILNNRSLEHSVFYLAQQLMHIQLAHTARGTGKNRFLWRMASDAAVNSMLSEDGFEVPPDAFFYTNTDKASAEAIYSAMLAESGEPPQDEIGQVTEITNSERNKDAGTESNSIIREIDDPGIAAAVTGLSEMLEPSLQLDYDWFPGDTIRDGMLRYNFKPYPVSHAEILLDTSVSVEKELLRAFIRGVKALLKDAVVQVGCFDTQFYGFNDINSEQDIRNLELRGSGGTDFSVAIDAFTGDAENKIIFTDGYAEMPKKRCDAIWVVYGTASIRPEGGRVVYIRPKEDEEKYEFDFLIT